MALALLMRCGNASAAIAAPSSDRGTTRRSDASSSATAPSYRPNDRCRDPATLLEISSAARGTNSPPDPLSRSSFLPHWPTSHRLSAMRTWPGLGAHLCTATRAWFVRDLARERSRRRCSGPMQGTAPSPATKSGPHCRLRTSSRSPRVALTESTMGYCCAPMCTRCSTRATSAWTRPVGCT